MTTIARTITTEAEWESLPVGTIARVGYIDHDDDGNEIDGGIAFVIRVDTDMRVNVSDYWLCGGKWWSDVWNWEQGVTVADLATLLPETHWPGTVAVSTSADDAEAVIHHTITGHQNLLEEMDHMPVDEYRKIPEADLPPESPAKAVLAALQGLGWAPAPVYPEGVQVWTVSGSPAKEIKMDGTMAYLSLPGRTGKDLFDYQDRGDIWLENPAVAANFEIPSRPID
ncbi:MAG TPA: hypothetical protein VF867_19920 [Arthrobacter sp.]